MTVRVPFLILAVPLAGSFYPGTGALAQGCVAARQCAPVHGMEGSAPVLGMHGGPYLQPGEWQLNYGYRYTKSDRHFIGDKEVPQRQEEGSEDINEIHLMDFGITRQVTKRLSLTFNLPVQIATRSTPIFDSSGDVIDRDTQRANGIGDMILGSKTWLFDPDENHGGNAGLGFGVKFPTGDTDVRHQAIVRQGGNYVYQERTVDQLGTRTTPRRSGRPRGKRSCRWPISTSPKRASQPRSPSWGGMA
jgi:hypothetical protein